MAIILVLEDDANMREILLETLEDEGHEVHGAASASDALEQSRARPFDLVVADVRMAGMDGLDCLGLMKGQRPDLRTVVITGYANDDAPLRALSIEVDDYLFKPFELRAFQRVVRRVLNAGQERASYFDMLGGFVSGYRKLVRKAGEALANVQLSATETDRDRFYQQFFVAVRSGMLLPGPALRVWDELERLEQARESLKEPGTVDWQKVRDGYRYLADLVEGMARRRAGDAAPAREDGQISRKAFGDFFGRVKRGEVSVEQLKVAPLLRTLDEQALRQSTRMWTLHREIWGDVGVARV